MIEETLLDGIPMLSAMSPRSRLEIMQRALIVRRKAGQSFWRAGDPAKGLLVVLEGRVRMTRTGKGGRTQVIHRDGPGALLGEVPLLDRGGYPASVYAESPVRALLIPAGALAAALSSDPEFAQLILRSLAARIRVLVDRLEALTVLDVRSRLARHLLDRANASDGDDFDLGATQAELAEDLGTVREMVVRAIAALRRRGILSTVARGRYQLLNRAALEALADL
jgi:CRP-like cAMP-binding protein